MLNKNQYLKKVEINGGFILKILLMEMIFIRFIQEQVILLHKKLVIFQEDWNFNFRHLVILLTFLLVNWQDRIILMQSKK